MESLLGNLPNRDLEKERTEALPEADAVAVLDAFVVESFRLIDVCPTDSAAVLDAAARELDAARAASDAIATVDGRVVCYQGK